MKSTHNKLRALGKGLGLAFLLVTGTAAMFSAFSGVTPSAKPGNFLPPSSTTVPQAAQHKTSDSLLYQRMTQSDGSQRWVLLEEVQAQAFAPASRDLLMAELPGSNTATLTRVSYTLQAKPAGWNRVLKNCAQAETGKPLGSAAAYDIVCAKLG